MAENLLIIAHRGASAVAPENTLAAFQKAVEVGADGIEFDVQLAKDGVPVVFHDSELQRIGQKQGLVSGFTAKELQTLDIGSWFNLKNPNKANPKFSAETIPTLAHLLEFLNDNKGLIYIELKCREAETFALVEAVCKIIRQTNLLPNIVVKSFNLEAVCRMRRLLPEVRTAALFAPKIVTILHQKKQLLKKAEECDVNEISIHYSLATQNFIEKAKRKGFLTTIWTADSSAWVKRALDLGVYAIITNNPEKLLAQRQKIFANSLG
ncbi:glycerophosphodiester phosphodiesterase [soil metagenome]